MKDKESDRDNLKAIEELIRSFQTLPKCIFCQKEITPDDKFCKGCGRGRQEALNESLPEQKRFSRESIETE